MRSIAQHGSLFMKHFIVAAAACFCIAGGAVAHEFIVKPEAMAAKANSALTFGCLRISAMRA